FAAAAQYAAAVLYCMRPQPPLKTDMFIPAIAKIRRALFAALLCAAAPVQAQAPIGFFVEKVTGTSLSVVNAPFAGGAVTYSWTPPAAKNGGPLEGYILHVREKPATPTAWPERSAE
ncbi:MAG: hypothetical protein MPK36_06890, partial [Gammaproteobacteria bacterium]|nr:hypothetical protein [Gammaproteobacteria bacterium]